MPTSSPTGNECDGYSYHFEPPEQGGQQYVRCEHCGRERLVALGGKVGLLHRDGCPLIGGRNGA